MNSQNLPWITVISFISLVKLSVAYEFPQYLGNPDEMLYQDCGGSFSCGSITGVDYPFRGNGDPVFCGYPGLVLDCKNNITTIDIQNMTFRVLGVDPNSQTLKIAREDVMESGCPQILVNTSMDNSLFDYDSNYMNLTFLYGCRGSTNPNSSPVSCKAPEGYGSVFSFPGTVGPQSCDVSVTVPVSGFSGSINSTGIGQAIQGGFEVKWKVDSKACSECTASNGRCGYEIVANRTTCYCPSEPYVSDTCGGSAGAATPESSRAPGSSKGFSQLGFKVIIGVSIIVSTVIVLIVTIYCLERKGILSVNVMVFWRKKRSEDQNVEAFIKQYGSLAPKQYRYSDINKMTNAFKEKLGKGGYGTVYKGKLSDGRLVAVKILSEIKGNGEEFINEVISISRTSHVNVVALLGFCFKRNKRALVYEFVANGSLDKFIYNSKSLEWKTLFQIAIGTARGLEYLHRGCSTRIVHFDIKPHNILLDEDFYPKISDFGLAKLCQRKQSIISMLGVRGTPGYIAPEVFSRAFGGVSHKSDVYSYGMLVLEIIGARENPGVVQTSEVYFPQWIYEHLEHGKDLRLLRVTTREEEETARKMILVGLWCIQSHPSDRPSMSKVLEMLEGSLESLQIPPKPSILSPIRLQTSDCDSLSSTMDLEVEMSASNPSSYQIPSKPLQLSPARSGQSASSQTSA